MYLNVRVFSLSQTYIGFRIIEKHYEEYKSQKNLNKNNIETAYEHGKYYNLLREKYFN